MATLAKRGFPMTGRGMTRRELLRRCGMSGAAYWLASGTSAAEDLIPATIAMDHLLVGVSSLEEGIAWVERLTGVKAVRGGSQAGQGTHNALLSLGGSQYLEIIAPDPEQAEYKPVNFLNDLRTFTEPRLFAWAAGVDDTDPEQIEAIAENFRKTAQRFVGPNEGSRARPDGQVLHWRSILVLNRFARLGAEPIPFLIQWAPFSPHPSEDSPRGCKLVSFAIEHPEPVGVVNSLTSLGIAAPVIRAKNARLRARLATPKGEVELS